MIKQIYPKGLILSLLLVSATTLFCQQTNRLPFTSTSVQSLKKNRSVKQNTLPGTNHVFRQTARGITGGKSGSDILVNNNNGATATAGFTQSETTVIAFGDHVVIGFNDAGSFGGPNAQFTGWSYSSDGGNSFTDGGALPPTALGDAGDPVMARDNTSGRIYFTTLGFNYPPATVQLFRSDDNGVSWKQPVNATPGGDDEDKDWLTVDNYAGNGNGNVYLLSRRFGANPGIYFFRSSDQGDNFSPNGGTLITTGNQGAFITVSPDHSINAFWYAGNTIQLRRSTDGGNTFGSMIVVASGLAGGADGDLALTGIRQGTVVPAAFRTNKFPHAAVNPVSGYQYVTYNNHGLGDDKGDVFFVMSTNNGITWSFPQKVNDDLTTTDQWMPTLAVSPDGKHIGFFYYSRQEDPVGNNLFKYYARIGKISGSDVIFDPAFAISSVPSLPEFGRDDYVASDYMGDYNTASATNDAFHVVWGDNRDDLNGGEPRKDPNVYYKKITTALPDTIPPVVTCPGNMVVSSDPGQCSKLLEVPKPAVTGDNNGKVTITGLRNDSLPLSAPYPVGTTIIVWTATDGSKNLSTCNQTITVNDSEPPVARCRTTILTLSGGTATLRATDIDSGSTDNCGIKSMALSRSDFNCSDAGNMPVTLSVTDIHGNTGTCTTVVTIRNEVPSCSIVPTPANNIYTDGIPTHIYLGYGPQSVSLNVVTLLTGATYTYSWSPVNGLSNTVSKSPVFTPTQAGSYSFTVRVSDPYGCSTTCSITIEVYDIRVAGANGRKVYVCHAPPGNPANAHTLSVSADAVPAHVPGHSGDRLGSCEIDQTSVVNNTSRLAQQENVTNTRLTIYPNPGNGTFDVKLDNTTLPAAIRILNVTGTPVENRIISANASAQSLHFTLQNQPPGMYYIIITNNQGMQICKLVINR